MSLFLSTFVNKIDKKYRVSVPATYRAVLAKEPFPGIVVYESFVNNSIEASGLERIEKIYNLIEQLEPFSEERDALATSVLGSAVQLSFDPEGRIILPIDLVEKIGLTDTACFVGKGTTFEIWQPDKFAIYKEKSLALARTQKNLLSLRGEIKK